jgi:hypothetical protein
MDKRLENVISLLIVKTNEDKVTWEEYGENRYKTEVADREICIERDNSTGIDFYYFIIPTTDTMVRVSLNDCKEYTLIQTLFYCIVSICHKHTEEMRSDTLEGLIKNLSDK